VKIVLIKNNLKSFLMHIAISIISVILFIFFGTSQVKWASEEAAKQHQYSMIIVSFAVIVAVCLLYYFLAKKFLAYQGSIYKNFLANSLIALVGVSLWIVAFNINMTGAGGDLLNSELWQLYSMYNGYSLFFLNTSGINNPYMFLLFSFVPTIVMGVGMQRKGRQYSLNI
jgi:hypothetical protein